MPCFQLSTFLLFLDYCTAFFNPDLQPVIYSLARKQTSTSVPWLNSSLRIVYTILHIHITNNRNRLAVDGQNSAPGVPVSSRFCVSRFFAFSLLLLAEVQSMSYQR